MLKKGKAVRNGISRLLKAGLGVVWLAAPLARGAQLVTLRSGFTITCKSQEVISASTLRLYLSTDQTTTNYIDIPLTSVATIGTEPGPVEDRSRVPYAYAPPSSELASILQRSGAAHNVNIALLASVVQAESGGNPHAVSRSGARGLMQLMPGTAAQLHVKQSFEPGDNVNGGSAYLDGLLTRYHENVALALAAYNAGPGAVDRYRGIPPFRETRLYIARVLSEFNRRTRQEAIAVEAGAAPEATNAVGMRQSR